MAAAVAAAVPPPVVSDQKAPTLKVVTLNSLCNSLTHDNTGDGKQETKEQFDARMKDLVEFCTDSRADVVLLQEVEMSTVHAVQTATREFAFYWGPHKDDKNKPVSGGGAGILIRKDAALFQGDGVSFDCDTLYYKAQRTPKDRRCAIVLRVWGAKTGMDYVFASVHLEGKRGDTGDALRIEQAAECAQLARKKSSVKSTIVFGGDFEQPTESIAGIDAVLAKNGLFRVVTDSKVCTCPRTGETLDFIYLSDPTLAKSVQPSIVPSHFASGVTVPKNLCPPYGFKAWGSDRCAVCITLAIDKNSVS